MPYHYEYPRAALTVDCVVFGMDDEDLKVMLIQRGLPPYEGEWALPGGFVHVDETVDEAARRELEEETGLTRVFLEQLYTFGALERDPRAAGSLAAATGPARLGLLERSAARVDECVRRGARRGARC